MIRHVTFGYLIYDELLLIIARQYLSLKCEWKCHNRILSPVVSPLAIPPPKMKIAGAASVCVY